MTETTVRRGGVRRPIPVEEPVILNMTERAGAIRETLQNRDQKKSSVEFISSGVIPLNLALSGRALIGGWARGRIVNIVGDGSSGKTLMAIELLFFAFQHIIAMISKLYPKIKKINLVYANAEKVMDFPLEEMYGEDFVLSIDWRYPETVEEWGRDFARTCMEYKPGEFTIYVVDSLDALPSQAQKERFLAAAKADEAEKDSYNTEKAKYLSMSFFANICSMMKDKDITLVVINQIREKIGVAFGEKYYRAGGKGLDFYTHQVVWLAEIEKLKKTVHGKEMVYGIRVKAKVKRSKVAKPFREAEFVILFDYGVDNISSSLAWLYGPKKDKLEWDGIQYDRAGLIAHIGKNNLQEELARRLEEEWWYIEENIKQERPPRF